MRLQYLYDVEKSSRWNYNTALPGTKQNLIYLQEVGDFHAGPAYFTTREGFDSYLLKLTVSGCGLLKYHGKQYCVPAGHFFWINCKEYQDYRTDPATGTWHVIWVHFYGATASFYYDLFLKQTNGEPVAAVSADSSLASKIEELLLLNTETATQLEVDISASAILTDLLSQCILYAGKSMRQQNVPNFVQSILLYLKQHYKQKLTLEDLGVQFALNPHYLQKVFKRYIGQSPTDYLIYLRMNKAKELLRTTQKSISEISYEIGLDNPGYFSRQFSKAEGMTPREYRQRWPRL